MKLDKFRKYLSWNIISLLGYFSTIIFIIFVLLYSLASSPLHMRADLDKYFYDYILNYIVKPYFLVYQAQIFLILILLLSSILENKYYKNEGIYGFRIFENHNKIYSIFFTIGIFLNLLPVYITTMFISIKFMKFIGFIFF